MAFGGSRYRQTGAVRTTAGKNRYGSSIVIDSAALARRLQPVINTYPDLRAYRMQLSGVGQF
ncbi:MAG: hypothetical protein NVSMB6_02630 [Burkholderiaceae bacterium]